MAMTAPGEEQTGACCSHAGDKVAQLTDDAHCELGAADFINTAIAINSAQHMLLICQT